MPLSRGRKPRSTKTVNLDTVFYRGQLIPASVAVTADAVWRQMAQVYQSPPENHVELLKAQGLEVKMIKVSWTL